MSRLFEDIRERLPHHQVYNSDVVRLLKAVDLAVEFLKTAALKTPDSINKTEVEIHIERAATATLAQLKELSEGK